jgi:perosamine synthetase
LISRLNAIPRFALPYTAKDFAAALFALMRGAPSPSGFEVLGASPKFWTRSGRQALQLLLSALDLPPGSGVALPLFTETLTIDPKSLDAASGTFSAVVIVHLFGQLADVSSLLSVARNLPVIEDTAHAPLSFLNGRMAGTFGLASFYSFASTKYWPAGGGGLAVVHDPGLAGSLAGLISSLRAPSHVEAVCNLALQCAKSLVFCRPFYGLIGMPLRRCVESWALLEPRLDTTGIEPSHAAAALLQASRFAERVEKQRSNSLRLLLRLRGAEDVVLPREPLGTRYNYHLFPVLVRDQRERAAVTQTMWKEFIDTSMIYSRAIDECRKAGYRGGCPVAESVAERLLTLPNHAALNVQEIDRVAEVFLWSLGAYRNAYPAARNLQ